MQNPLEYKKITLKTLAKTSFYEHPILKMIIDGEFWNGEIYGWGSNGKYIFIQGKKVYVYPPDLPVQNQTEIELENPDLFYGGLRQMKKTVFSSEIGNCYFCEFFGKEYSINDNGKKKFRVCKYPETKN